MKSNKFNKFLKFFNIQRVFLIVGLLYGLFCSIFLPVAMAPDEYTHIEKIEFTWGTSSYAAETEQYYDSQWATGIIHKGNHVNLKDYWTRGMHHYSKPLHLSDFNFSLYVVQYIPSGLGFYLGVALHLPILFCLQLAELFSLIFYLILGYFTLKIAPFRKELFLFCMLLPMTVQQVGSVNYDAVLMPTCFLLTAYILNLCVRGENEVTWKDAIVVALLSIVIMLVKLPYVMLATAVFMIPHKNICLKIGKINLMDYIWKFRWICYALILLALAAGIYLMRNDVYMKTLIACAMQPGRTLVLFKNTIGQLKDYYLQTFVGSVGWLNGPLSNCYAVIMFCVLLYLSLFMHAEERPKFSKLTIWNKVWMVAISLIVIGMVFLSMVTWAFQLDGISLNDSLDQFRQDLYKIDMLLGVQGRYFIPVVPMLLQALFGGYNIQSNKKYVATQVVFYIFAMFSFGKLIFSRYWS